MKDRLHRTALAALGAASLGASWLWAAERWREGSPLFLALFLAIPYALFAAAWRLLLPRGRAVTLAAVLVLLALEVAIEAWSPYPRRWTFASWELARAAITAIAMEAAPLARPFDRLATALRLLSATSLVILASTMLYLAKTGSRADPGSADAALVLGFALDDQGQARPQLVARIDEAVSLFQTHRVPLLVLSGGAAKAGRTEAQVMHDLARARGVPEEALLQDTRSRSTIENFACAKPLLDARAATTILVVTEPWHMTRAILLAKRDGYQALQAPAPSQAWRNPRSASFWLFRDAAAYLAEQARQPFAGPGACESPECDGCRKF